MNLSAVIVDILHIADTGVQTRPAITAQSVLAYIVKQSKNKLKEDIIKCKIKL